MVTIRLTKGKVALIDDADLAQVCKSRWHATLCGVKWYAKSRRVYLHRLLMPDVGEVDHINGDGLDCRRENLRPATRGQNLRNGKAKGGSSRFKGVSWNKNCRKWVASITVNYRYMHLGLFVEEQDAAKAYNAAARQLFGEFARENEL